MDARIDLSVPYRSASELIKISSFSEKDIALLDTESFHRLSRNIDFLDF